MSADPLPSLPPRDRGRPDLDPIDWEQLYRSPADEPAGVVTDGHPDQPAEVEAPRFALLGLGQAMRMVQVVSSHLPTDDAGRLDGALSCSAIELVTEVVEALAAEGYVIARQVRA